VTPKGDATGQATTTTVASADKRITPPTTGATLMVNKPASPALANNEAQPSRAPAQVVTAKRPYDLDSLVQDQMRELEDMMGEMHREITRQRP
jgi:hypothetical protein